MGSVVSIFCLLLFVSWHSISGIRYSLLLILIANQFRLGTGSLAVGAFVLGIYGALNQVCI